MKTPWRSHHRQYVLAAYRQLPITFARRVVFGRDEYWRRYFWSRWGFPPASVRQALAGGPVVWVDAISGGEVTQSVTFCRLLRQALPGYRFLLSTNNRYSYEFAVATLGVDAVLDSPWDFGGPVGRALSRISPVAIVAVENLTSPVLFEEARRRGAITVIVSGLMSRNFDQHLMMRRTVERKPFGEIDWIGAKTGDDARGFVALGARPDRVVVTGNMKYDFEYLRVADDERARLRASLQLRADEPVLLAASLHPGEERLVGEAYLEARRTVGNLRLVVVPRYQFHLDGMIETLGQLGLRCARRTALATEPCPSDAVVVVDTFGELSHLYATASFVFLGGSTYVRNGLGLGQNPIEPLAHRRPTFFGPVMNLWRDITEELKSVWSGVEVTSAKELAAGVVAIMEDPLLAARLLKQVDAVLDAHREDVAGNVDLVVRALGGGGKAGTAR